MNKWLLNSLRLAGLLLFIYGAYGNTHPILRTKIPYEAISKLYAGRYGYLTIIGLHLSMLTIIIALIESMLGNTKLSMLFIGITLPIEILITLFFWSLFLFKPEALLSKKAIAAGAYIPWTINIAQHLAPAVFLSVEFALISRRFRYSRLHIACMSAVSVGYFAWMHFLFTKNQRWAYPFIHRLSNMQRAAMLVASWLLCLLVYHLMHYISAAYHRRRPSVSVMGGAPINKKA